VGDVVVGAADVVVDVVGDIALGGPGGGTVGPPKLGSRGVVGHAGKLPVPLITPLLPPP
jgi:hypothetical protein